MEQKKNSLSFLKLCLLVFMWMFNYISSRWSSLLVSDHFFFLSPFVSADLVVIVVFAEYTFCVCVCMYIYLYCVDDNKNSIVLMSKQQQQQHLSICMFDNECSWWWNEMNEWTTTTKTKKLLHNKQKKIQLFFSLSFFLSCGSVWVDSTYTHTHYIYIDHHQNLIVQFSIPHFYFSLSLIIIIIFLCNTQNNWN